MEFKFRAVDGRLSANSGSSEAATQGPTVRTTLEATKNQYHMNVQEAIRREKEKEQIRQEIIAAEARRRELIAEVRREMVIEREMEMAIEREMAIRGATKTGISFEEERLTTWIDQSVLLSPINPRLNQQVALTDTVQCTGPFSLSSSSIVQSAPFVPFTEAYVAQVTPAVDPGKSKLIMLERPDSSLSEAKRKAEESPAVAVGEPHSSVSKKKPRAEWSCALCQVTATCEKGLNDHFQGKKHKAKEATKLKKTDKAKLSKLKKSDEAKLSKLKKSDEAEKASPTMAENAEVKEQSREQVGSLSRKRGYYKFWCDICNVGAFSEVVMETHWVGKKHKARLSEQENRDAVDTAKTTSTDLHALTSSQGIKLEDTEDKETGAGDHMTEAAAGENPVVEEERAEHLMAEKAGDNPVGEEAQGENPTAEEPKAEHPIIKDSNGMQSEGMYPTVVEVNQENPMAEEAEGENPTAEEPKAEYPIIKDSNEKQSEGAYPTVVEVNQEILMAEEATEDNPMGEEAEGENPTAEGLEGAYSIVVEVNKENLMAEEAKEEDPRVEELTRNRPKTEEKDIEDSTVDENKEVAPTMVEHN